MIDFFNNRKTKINLEQKPNPVQIKIMIIGNSNIGKTFLLNNLIKTNLNSYTSKDENDSKIETEAVDMFFYKFFIEGKHINLNLWDFSGKNEYSPIRQEFYSESNSIIYFFDATDSSALLSLENWIKECKRAGGDKLFSTVIGIIKSGGKKVITSNDVEKFCSMFKITFFYKENCFVKENESFLKLIEDIGLKVSNLINVNLKEKRK